jgi:hypothetical protein
MPARPLRVLGLLVYFALAACAAEPEARSLVANPTRACRPALEALERAAILLDEQQAQPSD